MYYKHEAKVLVMDMSAQQISDPLQCSLCNYNYFGIQISRMVKFYKSDVSYHELSISDLTGR